MRSYLPGRDGRRMLVALGLTLVPGLALGYLGFLAVAEREGSLRTNYTATIVLVRDRLAGELARQESAVRSDLSDLEHVLDNPAVAQSRLQAIAAARPWLREPFLLEGERVLAAGLASGWPRPLVDPLTGASGLRSMMQTAEHAEFVRRDLELALGHYRAALALAPSAVARGLVTLRIGRALFKLQRFEESIATYSSIPTLVPDAVDPNGIPYQVAALLQIADALASLNRAAERARCHQQLLHYIVNHPWDIEHGYGYYLGLALSVPSMDEDLAREARARQRAVATIEWITREIRPRIQNALSIGASSGNVVDRLALKRDNGDVLLGYLIESSSRNNSSRVILGYELQPRSIAGHLLTDVLKAVDLGEALRVELIPHGLDQTLPGPDDPAYIAAASREPPVPALAQADLRPWLSGWAVGLFDRDGRSIDQLVARERTIYGSLILGMLGTLLAGVALTMRAASREAELSRMKSEFVSNVSHELKTPLALIRMFGETLESGLVTDDRERTEFYGIIRRESERLTHLINNVLDVARIDAGTKQYTLSSCDVVQLVRDALDAYRPFFNRLRFQVEVALPDSSVDVTADREAIVQALVNLFDNAIKYSAEVKHVAVSVVVADGIVRVSVADRGVGIQSDAIPRVFEKHYRVGANASTPGSGLGLAIVKHAIEAHGGRVEVSSAPGRGSTFTITIPLNLVNGSSGHRVIDDASNDQSPQ